MQLLFTSLLTIETTDASATLSRELFRFIHVQVLFVALTQAEISVV